MIWAMLLDTVLFKNVTYSFSHDFHSLVILENNI